MQTRRSIHASHQREAVQAVLAAFEKHPRTHLVMACGSGKTRVALWVAEALAPQRIVVFVPSLALINQFLKEWLAISQWPKIHVLAICSDQTVTQEMDSITLDPVECDFPVTTDAVRVQQFLSDPMRQQGVQLVLCTYHSSGVLAKAMEQQELCKGTGRIHFDLGIFDEAHKTVGNTNFGLALADQALAIRKRLFMTATPKHYDVLRQNQAGEARLVYSMDNQEIYGPRAYTLSFRKAIDLGIISDYKIIVSVVNNAEPLDEHALEPKQVALKKALHQVPGISKVITFHQSIAQAHRFSSEISESEDPKAFHSFHVSSLIPSHDRKKIMDAFEQSEKALISNARCLTEGIDVPAVDMVAFLNKKRSKIDIIQAIGRAMRKTPNKHYGYVFLPLLVNASSAEDLESAVERANYQEIWEVLQALNEQDETLNATISQLQQEQGKTAKISNSLNRYLEIIDGTGQSTVSSALEQRLQKVISLKILEKVGQHWDIKYGQLSAFKQKEKHCNVPKRYSLNPSLGAWVGTQRYAYKKRMLEKNKIDLLDVLGFDWNPYNYLWHRNFEALKQFKSEHGHCNVPATYQVNQALSKWVKAQRQLYKQGKLEKIRINFLNTLNFDWEFRNNQWHRYFEALKQFKNEQGHCNVPANYQLNQLLANWVIRQRQLYKQGKLEKIRINFLNVLNFDWDFFHNQWHLHFEALKQFKNEQGHCNVPDEYPLNRTLANWVGSQRELYKKNKIDAEKIELLNALNFAWDAMKDRWHRNFEALRKFKNEQGHCNVPDQYPINRTLANWVTTQRQLYKQGKLEQLREKSLSDLGFVWGLRNIDKSFNFKLNNFK